MAKTPVMRRCANDQCLELFPMNGGNRLCLSCRVAWALGLKAGLWIAAVVGTVAGALIGFLAASPR